MSKLASAFTDLGLIFSKSRRIRKPWALLTAYARIKVKQKSRSSSRVEHFLGYTVHFPGYNLFYHLWHEIFLREVYAPPFFSVGAHPRIVDAGSNIGLSVLFFKRAFPDAKIVGLELSPKTFRWLEKNVRENGLTGDVQVLNAAVSGRSGPITFFDEGDGSSSNSIYPGFFQSSTGAEKATVPGKPLSEFLKERVDILKMDIEGAEFEALKEASGKLGNVENIVLEVHISPDHPENILHSILEIFEKNGFVHTIMSPIPPAEHPASAKYNLLVAARRKGE